MTRMFYREYPPPAVLKENVQCFWALEHDYRDPIHTHEHLWADTQIELIFSYGEPYYRRISGARERLPKNFVIGPFKKELLLYSDGLTGFVAVRFHPWGFAAFSKRKMTELINMIVPAEDVVGELPSMPAFPSPAGVHVEMKLEIIGNWLIRRLSEQQEKTSPVPEIARAVKVRKGVVKISELSDEFGLNPRQLERLFMREVGMSAKLFARILRFNHAKGLIERDPGISLAGLTYESGYADQAHFSHNFRELFGYTPAEFKTLMRGWKEKMAGAPDDERPDDEPPDGERPDVVFLQDKP
jgi:AraC-like DNA-binding protein